MQDREPKEGDVLNWVGEIWKLVEAPVRSDNREYLLELLSGVTESRSFQETGWNQRARRLYPRNYLRFWLGLC